MATVVVTNGSVVIGSTNISTAVSRAVWEYGAESQDETAFGDTTRIMKGGLKTWSLTIEGNQNYITGSVNAIFFSNVGSAISCITKQDAGSVTVTNPLYSGVGLLTEYSPAQMVQGELQPFRAVFVNAGPLNQALS